MVDNKQTNIVKQNRNESFMSQIYEQIIVPIAKNEEAKDPFFNSDFDFEQYITLQRREDPLESVLEYPMHT